MTGYFVRTYCDKCACTHWVELIAGRREFCHGPDLDPLHMPGHSARHTSGGMYRLTPYRPAPSVEWEILASTPRQAEIDMEF